MTDTNDVVFVDVETNDSSINLSGASDRVGVMWDTESLGLDSGTIVWDIAFIAFDLDDPEVILREANEHLPLKPQADLNRGIELSWLPYLLKMPVEHQEILIRNIDGEFQELLSLVTSVMRKYQQVTQGRTVENWFARPQHDIPLIQSLLRNLGMELPWAYDSVNDLRTLMNEAQMSARDPETKALGKGLLLHGARSDCLYQIRCLSEARRRLRSNI